MTNKKKQKSFKMIWNFFAEFSFTSQHFLKSSLLKNTSRKWLRKFHFRKKNPFPAIKFGKKIVRL